MDPEQRLAGAATIYALVCALWVSLPEVLWSREFRAGLAAVLEQSGDRRMRWSSSALTVNRRQPLCQ